jgi:hypothetical protein
MTINYLFFGLLKTDGKERDPDFKELFELFFGVYLDKTGDDELLEVIHPFYAFRGLVVASPVWYPNISLDTRRKMFNFIKTCWKRSGLIMKEWKSIWEDRNTTTRLRESIGMI